jgi:hypothetical protein
MNETAVQYKPGDKLLSTGQTIQRVVGQSAHAAVVITTDPQIRWEFHPQEDTPQRFRPAIKALIEISAFGRQVFPKKRDDFRSDLAEALWASFETPTGQDILAAFSDIRHRLEARWRRLATCEYLAGSLLFLLLLSLPLGYSFLINHGPAPAYWAVIGGAVGALLSIMGRVRNMQVDSWSPLWYWPLEGALRVLIGILSGLTMIALVNMDLFLGFARGRSGGLLLAGIVAGFSERLVPTLLVQLAHTRRTSDAQAADESPAV